jgi:hypothetical protein
MRGVVRERIRGEYQCPHYPPQPNILKSEKTQTQSTRIFSVKAGMVCTDTREYGFYCHV